MKNAFIVLLCLILIPEIVFSQDFSEDIQVIQAIKAYSGSKSSCFDRSLIRSDSDTYFIVKKFMRPKKEFKSFLLDLDASMPDLSASYIKIQAVKPDSAWNNAIVAWADTIRRSNENCSDYSLSIGKPIILSSENERLVIVTEYKYDRSKDLYDAFVYLYHAKKVNYNWNVCAVDCLYEIMDDWRM